MRSGTPPSAAPATLAASISEPEPADGGGPTFPSILAAALAGADETGQLGFEDRLRSVSRFGRLARWYEELEPTNSAQALGVRKRPA